MKKKIQQSTHEELIDLVASLTERLKKRNEELTLARHRLSKAKVRIKHLEGIVTYQRDRIIELHA